MQGVHHNNSPGEKTNAIAEQKYMCGDQKKEERRELHDHVKGLVRPGAGKSALSRKKKAARSEGEKEISSRGNRHYRFFSAKKKSHPTDHSRN